MIKNYVMLDINAFKNFEYMRLIHKLQFALLFFIAQYAIAQKSTIPDFTKAEMSKDRLALVEEYIEENIAAGIIPGGTFYIARKGEVVLDKAFGKKTETDDFVRGDIFRIASMTKALTTVAILQLYEQGKLKLDDPVHKYLPAFKNMTVLDTFNKVDSTFAVKPAENVITLRHLLTHTSGIYYGLFEEAKYRKVYKYFEIDQLGIYHPEMTTLEMADAIAKAPLKHEPGTQWTYGLSMDVLGAVIEKITKRKLSLIFLTEIFYPLGMHDAHFYLPEAKYDKLAPLFTYDADGKLIHSPDPTVDYPIFLNKGHYAGGGGVSCTARDYGRFLQALLNDGEYNGKRILSKSSIELMRTEQIAHLNKTGNGMSPIPGMSFCLGSALITQEGEMLGPFSAGTYSWGGYFNSKWWVDPKEEILFVGMTNVLPFPHSDFWDKLYAIIYAAVE